jgi:hypothetical protein
LVATERRLLLDDEIGTLRVMPSARLDPCVCDGGGSADINELEEVAAAPAVAVAAPCRGGDSAIGTADSAPAIPFDDRPSRSAVAGGSGVGAGMGCVCCARV